MHENDGPKNNSLSLTTELIDEPLQIFNDMNNRFEYDEEITEAVNKWLDEHRIEDKWLFEAVYARKDELKYAAFLGFLFSRGVGCKIDEKQAFKYYKLKADMDDPLSQNQIGSYYHNGFGVKQDYKKAFYWLEKSANNGYVTAHTWLGTGQFWLGICHYRGIGTAKSIDESFSWFMKAAAQGESRAMDWLGYLYQCGGDDDGCDLKINKKYAAYWYGKAAKLGNRSAQSNFGTCYELGIGLNRDIHEALRWLQRASLHGNEFTRDPVVRILSRYRTLYY
ncbi:14457_t:CDS:2 [Ambispora leptoticha]|uniref:14457_t:CDS:1 n=1 Tax=Ambispora leptoticha TaxID=144679 RepID=A0A9N9F340_9GLOM|nr:14457_t:CDS:2 [Ambispora leptoticha]